MTSDTEQPVQTTEPGTPQTKSVASAAVKPKARPNAAKRPPKRRAVSKPTEPSAYDQGFRSGPRVWPD